MRFLEFTIVVPLKPLAFASEQNKDADLGTATIESLLPVITPVGGTCRDDRFGLDKSIPIYLEFEIKAEGKLLVLNAVEQVIGTGIWAFNGDVFGATYTVSSSGQNHLVKGNLYEKPGKSGPTSGNDNEDAPEMIKTN